jgi:hypothetical protein
MLDWDANVNPEFAKLEHFGPGNPDAQLLMKV